MPTRHTFTIREAKYIDQHWRTHTDEQMGAALGLSRVQIQNYRQRNKLTGKERGFGCFKKGMTPWNKGLKHKPKGSQATQFRAGHTPINTQFDGAISIRRDKNGTPYKYVRLDSGKWVYLHRELWRRKRGDIKKGMIVAFRDGDTMHCRIGNLELITRAENMRRNHNRPKAAAALRQTIKRERIRIKYNLQPKTRYGQRLK